MDWRVVAFNIFYAAVGVALMFASYRVIDRLTPEVDFPGELRRGNVAVGIVIAAIFIAIALVVSRSLS